MQHPIEILVLLAMVLCSIGCEQSPQPKVLSTTDSHPTDKASETRISIEPGFYSDGPEYDRVTKVLSAANAKIGLDPNQGIEWYDQASKSWKKLGNIAELEPLLNGAPEKNLITVSMGKAMWDKYDEYIALITAYAKTAGYSTTVVTDSHSSGTIVSNVVHHKD